MGYPQPHGDDRPQLKLFHAEELFEQGVLSPESTLSAFFRLWFKPVVLNGDGRADETSTSYRESIDWWAALVGDPPLSRITEFTVAEFKAALRKAEFRRGLYSAAKPLKPFTQAKHQRQVRTVLARAIEQGFVTMPHSFRVERPHLRKPKPSFTVGEARRILGACEQMDWRRRHWPIRAAAWWKAHVLVLFYTGLRVGTVRQLEWPMLEQYGEGGDRVPGWYLNVPGEITKTGEPVEKFLHPLAYAAIEILRTKHARIFEAPVKPRHQFDEHQRLQKLAGLAADRLRDMHAWRRTHGTEMGKLGAEHARKIAQHTLGHASVDTTNEFYVDIEAELISNLPRLDLFDPAA